MKVTIEETKNYDQFRDIKGNRLINRVYLQKLEKSILTKNMLLIKPVIVNERFQVIDGQHRIEVCKKLDIPVPYVVLEGAGMEEMRMLNTNVRNWTMMNYLDSYITIGKPEYIKLRKFMDKTGLGLGLSLLMLTGFPQRQKQGEDRIEDFKNGDFVATKESFAYELYKQLEQLSKFTEQDAWQQREFVRAVIQVYRNNYTFDELYRKMEQSNAKISPLRSGKQYRRVFEDILSFKSKNPVRLV